MTRDKIISDLFTGKNFNECIDRMNPDHLRQDLKMEVIGVVCTWTEEKVLKLHEAAALEFYVVRVILNQIQSNSSPFAKMYRKPIIELNGHEKADEGPDLTREIREALEDKAISEIKNLYWYDAELIQLYLKHGNYRAIEKETGIPWESCYKSIRKALKVLKARATGEYVPVFSQTELAFIQKKVAI